MAVVSASRLQIGHSFNMVYSGWIALSLINIDMFGLDVVCRLRATIGTVVKITIPPSLCCRPRPICAVNRNHDLKIARFVYVSGRIRHSELPSYISVCTALPQSGYIASVTQPTPSIVVETSIGPVSCISICLISNRVYAVNTEKHYDNEAEISMRHARRPATR